MKTQREAAQRVRVTITNRSVIFHPPFPETALLPFFRYRVPGYYFSPAYRMGAWDGYTYLLKNGACPTGLFLEQKREIKRKLGIKFRIKDLRVTPAFHKLRKDVDARLFQDECLTAMVTASDSGGVVLSATGTGKTYIAGKYFKLLDGRGVFVVDELTLLRQTKRDLEKVLGEKVGMIGNSVFQPRRITVATIQTLHKRRKDSRFRRWYRDLDVAIIDELHLALNRRNIAVVRQMNPKAVFGLTATLQLTRTAIRLRAAAICGPVIFRYPLLEGVKDKHLTPGVAIGVDIVKRKPSYCNGYREEYPALITRGLEWNEAIRRIAKVAVKRGKHVLILVDRVKHLRHLSAELSDVPHKLAYGHKKVIERVKAIKQFEASKIRLLIANKVFMKGISINALDLIIDGASLRSPNTTQQKYGRGVRLCHNKRGLIFIDVGYRNPDGVEKGDKHWNRFHRAAKQRRRALRAIGITVKSVEWDNNPKAILDAGERQLDKLLVKERLKHT